MKNIHVLPTEKPSRLLKFANHFIFDKETEVAYKRNQHIYITSDEEIKEGDWAYCPVLKKPVFICLESILMLKNLGTDSNGNPEYKKEWLKKIILTTDSKLIDSGVQAISDEFLEWFVKNPSCEFVSVQKRYSDFTVEPFIGYKIIIPQEEPKQETRVFGTKDDKSFWSDKPKQETPEEAAEKYANDWEEIYPELDSEDITPIAVSKIDFIAGAKWQAERMYSEEDMREAFKANYTPFSATNIGDVEQDFQKWFEQFKKK